MDQPGIRHLGFTIPLAITVTLGRRYRTPSSGPCVQHLRSCEQVYLMGDGRPICYEAIRTIYADKAHSLGGQPRPGPDPKEVVHEKSPVADDFDLPFWERAFT